MATSKNLTIKANPAKDKKVTEVVKTVVPETEQASPEPSPELPNNAALSEDLNDGLTAELVAKMQPYIKAYPTNKTFHIATDGQVFLEANTGDAIMHQRTLDGDLVTFSPINN